jgi:Flp pilus assembly pilin Flp
MELWSRMKRFWQDEEGLGTLEILLICVVLVGVALLFRKNLAEWVNSVMSGVGEGVDQGTSTELPSN